MTCCLPQPHHSALLWPSICFVVFTINSLFRFFVIFFILFRLKLLEIYQSKFHQLTVDIKTHLQWIEKHQTLDVIDGSGDHVTFLATSFRDVLRKQLVGSIAGLKVCFSFLCYLFIARES